MAGPGDPPEGTTPEGAPGGGEDEYRSVVFDESFVRAARLQEFSAQERMGDHARAVRARHAWARGGPCGPRQALMLVVLIALAFGTAVYMGVRHPYNAPRARPAEPLRTTVIPLAPHGAVPGARPADLFAHSPAAQFRIGAEGVNLPAVRRTDHFSDSQMVAALTTAKEYIVRSSLDPRTLTGGSVRPVRLLLDTGQLDQFDRSLEHPDDDGRHAATGWLIRFDPAVAALADPRVRVNGTMDVSETGADALEVNADHTFVYAVRAVDGRKEAVDAASLFTVRRALHFRFDRDDLRDHRLELRQSALQAGPLDCSSEPAGELRPLLAGQRADNERTAGTDPYSHDSSKGALCGLMAAGAQPSPHHPVG